MRLRMVALGFGVVFGFLLSWGQLTDPDVIQRMLLLHELDVFLLMGSAMAVAFVGARVLRHASARSMLGAEPITWSTTQPSRDHILGSFIFGFGWSVASTCPGPMAAQLGQGTAAGLFTLAGLIGGIALRGWVVVSKSRATEVSTAVTGM